MFRKIVDFGEKTSGFFADDLQNIYYQFLFKRLMKSRVKKHDYSIDSNFQAECKRFWKQYTSISSMWHDFYSFSNGIKDVRYIPENIYYSKIEPYFNNKPYAKAIDDKNYYSELFKGYNHTTAVVRNIAGILFDKEFQLITLEQALSICLSYEKVV